MALITEFSWMIYVFGVFLILTALKLLFSHNEQKDPHDFKIYKWIAKVYPVTTTIEGDKFFIIKNGVKLNIIDFIFIKSAPSPIIRNIESSNSILYFSIILYSHFQVSF